MLETKTFLYTTFQDIREKCIELGYSREQFHDWLDEHIPGNDCYINYCVDDDKFFIDKALIAMGAKLDDEILIEICW